MNTITPIGDAQEYRASMQQAARAFLQRHQAEHLTDDGQLFARGVHYLVHALDVPAFMADRLVHLAMTDLDRDRRPWVGVDYAAREGERIGLTDLRTGETVLIPLRHLPARLQPPAAPLAAAATH